MDTMMLDYSTATRKELEKELKDLSIRIDTAIERNHWDRVDDMSYLCGLITDELNSRNH